MSHPHVSVVLPVYNRVSLVRRAVESVLLQSYRDLELIVVDDASTDDTVDVVAAIQDPRLRLLKQSANQGGAAARNTALRAARGVFIAFQDSDDVWRRDKLERQLAVFAESADGVGVVYSGCIRQHRARPTVYPPPSLAHEGWVQRPLLAGNFVTTQVALVRRACFEQVGGFDESLPRLQDWELWLRVAQHYTFRYLAEPLVEVHYTDTSISSNPQALFRAQMQVLAKHESLFHAAGPSALANMYTWIGHSRCLAGDLTAGRSYLRKALAHQPTPRAATALLLAGLGAAAYRRVDHVYHRGRQGLSRWQRGGVRA